MSKERCANCRFWQASFDCPSDGQCRRRAPIAHGPGHIPATFPLTFAEVWCGEWEPNAATRDARNFVPEPPTHEVRISNVQFKLFDKDGNVVCDTPEPVPIEVPARNPFDI